MGDSSYWRAHSRWGTRMARTRYRTRTRAPRRQFIWVRKFDQLEVDSFTVNGVDLLEDFRNEPGATHLGATIMRIRGFIIPLAPGGSGRLGGAIGLRVGSTGLDPTRLENSPSDAAEADWMAWLPFLRDSAANPVNVGWNSQAEPYAVDVKANRKVQEHGQTLWMLSSPAGSEAVSYQYNLSIGLKLP